MLQRHIVWVGGTIVYDGGYIGKAMEQILENLTH